MTETDYISMEECARRLGQPYSVVSSWRRRNLIPWTRIGKRVLIPVRELDETLRAGLRGGRRAS